MNTVIKELIFDIQRYAIHDGPGIRTTAFLKGCPIRCKWCANPESQQTAPEISYLANDCIHCGSCARICPQKAIAVSESSHVIDRGVCDLCGLCIEICPAEALQMIGRYVTPAALFDDLAADQPFWKRSGGGITLSGGEPLAQPEFVLAFLQLCRENYVHTVIESCLHAPRNIIRNVLLEADDIICDIKIMDANRHKTFVGVSNEIILENLTFLLQSGKPVLVRIPLIPSINDDQDNLEAAGRFLSANRQNVQLELLPYHRLGESKYSRLGRIYSLANIVPPTGQEIENAKKEFIKFNISMA